jgi:3-oxoacyl-[acyl-carrier protein] reductase
LDLGLNGKVALVLASSKGIGLSCARVLFNEGAHVIICSRNEENLVKAKATILNEGRILNGQQLDSVVADLNKDKDITHLVELVMKKHGRIDIVIHNAGGPPSGKVENITLDQWNSSLNLNLLSVVKICKLITPIMQHQKFGRIIMITSVSVKQPLDNLVLSNSVRLGVVGYAKTLANELAVDNILINVVCPGPTLTNRMKKLIHDSMKSGESEKEVMMKWINQIPMGRLGSPEEIANLIAFLASEKASFITGTVISVDGGFVKSSL